MDGEKTMLYFWLFLAAAAGIAVLSGILGAAWWLCIVIFLLAFVLIQLLTLAVIWLLIRKTDLSFPEGHTNPLARTAIRHGARIICLYGGIKAHLQGLEKLPRDSRFLYVCNHRSLFDPMMAMAYLADWDIAFISKPSNFKIPLGAPIVQAAGYLAIDRENDRNALKTILTAADFMKRGVCSIGIYPEGTRSHTGELLPFHKGSFKAAQRANVPLAIACIQGSEKLKHGLLLHPHDVTLTILELVPAEKVKAMNTAELADYARDRIQECLDGGKAE